MSQHEQSKGGHRKAPKEKTSVCRAGRSYPVVFPLVENSQCFGSAILYPALLEHEEDNIGKLPLHYQHEVRFGLLPRYARLTHVSNIDKGETHVSFS
jgi:hypothetical protein